MVTQTDKLLLSKLLPLAEYAHFTLAVLVASGVMIISGPISGAILPRLTKLVATGDHAGLIRLYRNATQLVAVIATPAALVLAFFSEQVLWVWTGDAALARKAAPVLQLYALGNGILVLSAFPYYLQYAKGDLKLHLLGNTLFLSLLIPSILFATTAYGVVGAGWAWLSSNLIYFLIWIPLVHKRFDSNLHLQWLIKDIAPVIFITLSILIATNFIFEWPVRRDLAIGSIACLSLFTLAMASVGSSVIRLSIQKRWSDHFKK